MNSKILAKYKKSYKSKIGNLVICSDEKYITNLFFSTNISIANITYANIILKYTFEMFNFNKFSTRFLLFQKYLTTSHTNILSLTKFLKIYHLFYKNSFLWKSCACNESNEILNNIEEMETEVIKQAIEELKEYFEGTRKIFTVLINPKGTEFQQKVWNSLRKIPYGETRSYKDIAVDIGNNNACRAVGSSNGKNPIPIIIPCHRIINSNGNLGGFSGGLKLKIKLLQIENCN